MMLIMRQVENNNQYLPMLISSTSNQKIKYIRKLINQRKTRKSNSDFVVEGVQLVYEAYRCGWQVKWLVYCENLICSDWAKKTIAESEPETHLQVTESLMYKLSERTDTELIAVVSQPDDNIDDIPIRKEMLVVLLENPQNTGNLGTIIRSCSAMGAHGLLIIEPAVDLYNPKTIRATMGTIFTLPVVRIKKLKTLQKWLDKVRVEVPDLQLVGTSPHASARIYQHDFTLPTILITGNEQSGISESIEKMCDVLVSIPMFDVLCSAQEQNYRSADSLNSAIATSISLYEVSRQRLNKDILFNPV